MKQKITMKNGYTNIELIIGVGVVSVLSTMGYFLYENTSDKRMVTSEIKNLVNLVNRLKDASQASTYEDLNRQKLESMGIFYHEELKNFEIKGIGENTFEVSYSQINSRQCNDFMAKTIFMKGDYVLLRNINDKSVGFALEDFVNLCSSPLNKISLVFTNLKINKIVSVTPGALKPPVQYAPEGSLLPPLPDRGDVPINMNQASKSVSNPNKPQVGQYIPPQNITVAVNIPNNNENHPNVFVRPDYGDNNPLGPLNNLPDNGNEWIPVTPPIPPAPPPISNKTTLTYNKVCVTGSIVLSGTEFQNSCRNINGFVELEKGMKTGFGGEVASFRAWAVGRYGLANCPYPYSATGVAISLWSLNSDTVVNYDSGNVFNSFIPTLFVYDTTWHMDALQGALILQTQCNGFN